MNYSEKIVDHNSLKNDILCYWTMSGVIPASEDLRSRHTPKGQNLLIFNYGDKIELVNSTGTDYSNAQFFIFPAEASSQIISQKGTIDLFGISFIGDGLYKLIQHPISKLNSHFPESLMEKYHKLYADLKELNFNQKIECVESFLLENINHKIESSSFVEAVELIKRKKGVVKISEIATHSQISERQLQRLFKTRMGISPKDYCKIERVNSYLNYILDNEKSADWFDLVVEYNYHDQPHFINEVKMICKLSPKKLLKYRDTLYHHYIKK